MEETRPIRIVCISETRVKAHVSAQKNAVNLYLHIPQQDVRGTPWQIHQGSSLQPTDPL